MSAPAPASIHVLLSRVQAELPAIGKNQRNVQQGFNFRGVDDVLNALNPLLAQHGVFFVPEVLERIADERTTRNGGVMYVVNLHVRYTFYGPAGDTVVADAWGEGTDSGDKATNKAMTSAMKYMLFQVLAIATEETAADDSDRTTPEETTRHPAQPSAVATSNGTRRPPLPVASAATIAGIVGRLNLIADPAARRAAKVAFLDRFGEPDHLRAADVEAAKAFLVEREAGQQQELANPVAGGHSAADDYPFEVAAGLATIAGANGHAPAVAG